MKKLILTTIYLYFLVESNGEQHQPVDYSPYCDALARITTLCSEWYINTMCQKTCQIEHMLTKTCGKGKLIAGEFEGMRKKRFDQQLKDEDDLTKHSRQRRVIGGKASVKGAFPWHVGLYYEGRQRCGGAVLSQDWIITTAHCFDEFRGTSTDPSKWSVVAGDYDLFTSEHTEETSKVKNIIVHQKYHKYTGIAGEPKRPDDYDIALLKLETPIPFNTYIAPICVLDDLARFSSTDDCRVIGWAKPSTAAEARWYHTMLQEAKVKLVPHDICNLPLSYNGTIHKRAICAGYSEGSADACDNDSGGTLACQKNLRWYAVGLISFGHQCGPPKAYGVFTNVAMMKSWLVQTILSYDNASNSLISLYERISSMTRPTV